MLNCLEKKIQAYWVSHSEFSSILFKNWCSIAHSSCFIKANNYSHDLMERITSLNAFQMLDWCKLLHEKMELEEEKVSYVANEKKKCIYNV